MLQRLIDQFYWNDIKEQNGMELTAEEKYKKLVSWAGKARGQNPNVFDELTSWILDDEEWAKEKLADNEQTLMQGVVARFKEQNAQLRKCLKELEPSGVVNAAVYKALDKFNEELSGNSHDKRLQKVVTRVFADFSAMQERRRKGADSW